MWVAGKTVSPLVITSYLSILETAIYDDCVFYLVLLAGLPVPTLQLRLLRRLRLVSA